MRFTVGLSMAVILLGLVSVALNLHNLSLVLVSLMGIGFAVVPLLLLRWINRMGQSPKGVPWMRAGESNKQPRRGRR